MTPEAPSQSIDPTTRVRRAFETLARLLPDYHRLLFASRAGLDSQGQPSAMVAGSCYPQATPERLRTIIEHEVVWTSFAHPLIAPGCVAFVACELPIEARYGLVEVETLPRDARILLSDPKGTGFVEAHVAGVTGEIAEHTVAILGIEKGDEVVFTFHPGNPIPPSRVPSREMGGKIVDPDLARGLGLTLAKIVPSL